MSEPTAFYTPIGGSPGDPDGPDGPERFESSELTRGPWDGASQHAGPPAALLARALERVPRPGGGPTMVGRITFEILAPVPIAPLAVEARVARPGKRVEMLEAVLRGPGRGGEEQELVKARAWRLRTEATNVDPSLTSTGTDSAPRRAGRPSGLGPPPPPGELRSEAVFFPTGFDVGYHTAMEYRFATGSFTEPGPAVCWMRMRHPLVAREEPSPLVRVLTAADSGNGISSTLDFERFIFINVDLTVHLHRLPAGEWVCLDSLTVPEPEGVGMSDTLLGDERGPIGRANQTLLIAERQA